MLKVFDGGLVKYICLVFIYRQILVTVSITYKPNLTFKTVEKHTREVAHIPGPTISLDMPNQVGADVPAMVSNDMASETPQNGFHWEEHPVDMTLH
jgi:hypothetical protein